LFSESRLRKIHIGMGVKYYNMGDRSEAAKLLRYRCVCGAIFTMPEKGKYLCSCGITYRLPKGEKPI